MQVRAFDMARMIFWCVSLAMGVQVKVAKSVEVARRYRHVLWYSVFVAVYLIVLYLQARPHQYLIIAYRARC